MDIVSLTGVVGALALIAVATGGKFAQFIDLPAVMIVFGGTFLCVLAKSSVAEFRGAWTTAREVLRAQPTPLPDLIDELMEVGRVARYDDRWMVTLEDRQYKDAFIAKAVRMWVDGIDHALLKDALLREITEMKIRYEQARDFFGYAQELAPGMGMIGTLVGLVLMMGSVNDPRTIGPGMAVALLTTLYGAVLANVVLGPLVQKISGHGKRVRRNYEMAMAGVLFVHKGGDPRLLPDLLLGRLPDQQEADAAEALPPPKPDSDAATGKA
jgi:chemotaxis protein MotA